MTFEELEEEIAVELEALESTVNELLSLQGDVPVESPPSVKKPRRLLFWRSFTMVLKIS